MCEESYRKVSLRNRIVSFWKKLQQLKLHRQYEHWRQKNSAYLDLLHYTWHYKSTNLQ